MQDNNIIQDAIDTLKRLHKENTELKAENVRLKSCLQEIKAELEEDTTCESRECGCDDYGECLNCLKETILIKITKAESEQTNEK